MIQTIMLRCKCGSRLVWRGDKDYWSHEKQRYVGLDDSVHIVNAWNKRHEECMRDPKRPHVKCAREVVENNVTYETCPVCRGRGSIVIAGVPNSSFSCRSCHGAGVITVIK
jgi:DnaJ-class molecular chaperone